MFVGNENFRPNAFLHLPVRRLFRLGVCDILGHAVAKTESVAAFGCEHLFLCELEQVAGARGLCFDDH